MEEMLGVIGGMGPLATQTFYRLLTEHTAAARDQEHINVLILSHAAMPDRTAAILSGEVEPVRQAMLQDALFLQKSGCKALVATCNTAHYFVDLIAPELEIPVLHMVKETAKEAVRQSGGQPVGVLATDGTLKTGLYQRALEEAGGRYCYPPEEVQRMVMSVIYDEVKAGRPTDPARWRVIEEAMDRQGCGRLILGCTELSCLRDQLSLGERYIDPLDVIARKAVVFMGGRLRE